jgi:hypothetical protein
MKRVVFLVIAGLLLSTARALAAPDAPADDKEGTIAGTAIKRDHGGWLGLELRDGNFRLTFYNDKKKPIAADRTSAVFRWPVHYQPNDERTELVGSDDPDVLASPYPVKPPYAFKLHIALLGGDQKDGDVEAYTINFSG